MKRKKVIIILVLIFIAILSFIIPIRKEEKWKVIKDTNPTGFYGGGFTTSERYEYYYNIYGLPIMRKPTGEIQTIG